MNDARRESAPPLIKVVAGFGAVYVIWGSTYLAIKFAVYSFPVFLMPGIRFFCAGTILYIGCRATGTSRPTWRQWRDAAIVGGLLLYVANGLVVWAEFGDRVPSGLTALLIAVVPLCMVLLDWLRPGGRRPTRLTVTGLILGLVGIGLLTGPKSFAGGQRVDLLGAGALILASFVWSAGSIFSRSADKPPSPYITAAMQMMAGGLLHLASGTIVGEWGQLEAERIAWPSVVAVLYLIFFGSIVAFTAYMWLLRVSTPARVATYAYVNPVVAVFLGWLLADEALNPRVFIAATVIVTAVVFITRSQAKPETSARVEPAEKIIHQADDARTGGSQRPETCLAACGEGPPSNGDRLSRG